MLFCIRLEITNQKGRYRMPKGIFISLISQEKLTRKEEDKWKLWIQKIYRRSW